MGGWGSGAGSGGARPRGGRPKGSTNLDTRDTRGCSRRYWANAARNAYLEEQAKARALPRAERRTRLAALGPPPAADDPEACINYLNALDHAALAFAMQRHDYSAAHEIIEDARDRALGRVKYQVEQSGPEGAAIPVKLDVLYTAEFDEGGVVPIPIRPGSASVAPAGALSLPAPVHGAGRGKARRRQRDPDR